MSQREDALKFETGRIKALQEERLHIQKKTFTKWMNSFLVKARMEVEDLFTDLADGKKLLKLLEIISGEKLGKPNNGRMRVHKIENVNKSLAFLHTKVRLESIGAEDIVDGNPRLILGLIWTIILRFQIQEIEIDVDEENESSEKKSAKDALLLWCQRKTKGYPNVNIQDFSGSWRSGLGFNALIHAHRPDLIEFDKLVPSKHIDNLNNAFDVAERQLGIVKLLDPEDCDTAKPDEKSVITYVASYYHTFAQMYNKDKSGRRIVNIVSQIKEADDLKTSYELGGKSLLAWIRKTITLLNSRDFPNNLEGVQKLLQQFKEYITAQKPPKYNEKSEIEANYFIINTRLKELNRNVYVPPEGLLVQDIERAWEELEKSEYQRELALREEVIRQTNLEQLAIRFEKKSLLREGYLKDMIQVLSDPRYGINLTQVEATLKKHEAISADILAREQRCEQLVTMADYLVKEKFHDCGRVRARADEITRTWNQLIGLLDTHKGNLEKFSTLMQMIRDIDTLNETIRDLEENFASQDGGGGHLEGVESLLQKHSLVESQISSMGDTIKRIGKQVGNYGGKEREMVDGKIKDLNSSYARLVDLCKTRRGKLEDSRAYFQFVQDLEEEEAWVNEKTLVFGQPIVCKDLRGVLSLIGAHKIALDEMKARRSKFGGMVERGNELAAVWEREGSDKAEEVKDVRGRIRLLEGKWKGLWDVGEERNQRLRVVLEAFQFYSDANEMDSWVTEKRPLVSSSDYGEDEPSAQALLRRHVNLEEEIIAYDNDVKNVNAQADKLVQAGINSIHELSENQQQQQQQNNVPNGVSNGHGGAEQPESEFITEKKLVPEEYYEDEVVEKTDYRTVTEERAVPQVKALYAFQGQEIEIKKGEVMFLLNKTNSDWWNVRKANGEDGFVPANYVKEIEPKVVMVQVRKPEVVKETKRVKKTRMVLQNVTKPIPKKPTAPISNTGTLKKSSSTPSQLSAVQAEPILTRTNRINVDYTQILSLCAVRKRNLQESIKLFQFLRECDDFEKWISEKRKYLESSEPNVQVAKRAFETFLTDLTASNNRVGKIEKLVNEFEVEGCNPKTLDKVRARGDKVKRMYEELLSLKSNKEKTLEGALSVELFNRTCEEVQDWMGEKMMQIDTDEWSNDLKTVQALQRKHNNLERELAPIQEKVGRVELLAESVKKSYPNETENVDERKREVVSRWEGLVNKANDRKHALENAVGLQIFVQGVKNLLHWVGGAKDQIGNYVASRDVSSAEEALKAHSDLGDEIKSKEREFEELRELGGKIRNANKDVDEKLALLAREQEAIVVGYGEKTDWLNQVLDLQMFLREADHIDSATRNQIQFLGSGGVGENLDEIESLIKRHTDFENTLVAGDERVRIFDQMGGKLVEAGHFEVDGIQERRTAVIQRREQVKDLAKTRKNELLRSLKYHEFNNDVEETLAWVNEKIKVAKDESYKDLALVDKKLKKHEAFAGELRANEVRIKNINRAGEKLVEVVPEKDREIRTSIQKLNALWEELVLLSGEKYEKLKQAEAQAGFNKNLDGVIDRLGSIKNNVYSDTKVADRRSCKDAVKRANSLGAELAGVGDKIKELETVVEDMEKEKHFDRERIRVRVDEAKNLMEELKGPVDLLKEELGGKYAYYCFLYEVGVEQGWIAEKRALVDQEVVVSDLYQAQTVVKKHKKIEGEVMNREPLVKKLLEKGLEFSQYPDVHEKLEQFKNSWEGLKSACTNKSKKLELSLKSQQFFFDAGEIETWMQEKQDALTSKHYGKDIHSAVKLLTKHKTLELEMDSYNGLVQEMKHMANAMVQAGHPDKVLISAKIRGVEDHMGLLRRLGNERRERLIRCVHTLEYFAEADEFLKCVDEVFGREVGSNDYGDDYEKLCVLKNRFKEVELKVDGVNDRFKALDEVAAKLRGGDGDGEEFGERSVEQTHEELREKWNTMLSLMASREQKLHAAGEIHAFNRDVADALARINEKLNSIPEIVGRDVNSCEGMLRQHEAFENDLLALEAQLQVLVDDAARLQTLYPTNAQNIRQEQALVIESWSNLQNRATLRKEQLQNAVDFWRFSAEYANLTSFISSLLTTLPSQPKVRDTASSQALMNEHERIRSEIDARNDQFQRVFGLGNAMLEEGHPESSEVERLIGNLGGLREKLDVAWEHKKVYLDQLIDLNIFLRDAKQLETVCCGQEVNLRNIEVGDSVESVGAGLKKFVEFEKVVEGQEDKFKVLESQGGKLVRQRHFESRVVEERLKEVAAARARVKDLCRVKKEALEARLKYVRFIRDVNETTAWVDEKVKKLKHDESVNSGLNLQEKIKKLKKHRAFSAEVKSNENSVEGLFSTAKDIGAEEDVQELKERWGTLVALVQEFGKGLDEAYDILEFTNQCEQTDEWVREKESLVHSGDTGRDFEHCSEIIKRLDEVDRDRVDHRIKSLNLLADKLISVTGDGDGVIERTRTGLNSRWENLKGNLESYRVKLNRALETHKYNRDAEEIEERIDSKIPQLVINDLGRNLENCETLCRKQDALESQVHAVGERVRELEGERIRLQAEGIDENLLKKLEDKWLTVSEACLKRRNALTSSLEYHKFLKKFTDLKNYVDAVDKKIDSTELGGNVQEAEDAAKAHQELINEVNAREPLFVEVVKIGKRYVVEDHEYAAEFKERVSELEDMKRGVGKKLEGMKVKLGQSVSMQRLFSTIHEIEQEIEYNESFLNRHELGESLGAVVVLVRHHGDFVQNFGGIEVKVSEVIAEGESLIPGHYDAQTIASRLTDLTQKLDRLKSRAQTRATKLHESYELHKFVLEIHDIETYALEKLKIATDDNYSDMGNLQSKIQRHAAFESEVKANENRVSSVVLRSEELLNLEDESNALHAFSVEIHKRIENLRVIWKELMESSALKRERLQESYQALLFNQNLDDIDQWMDELENQLESEDHGSDLESVEALINKWVHLEAEFNHKADVIGGVGKTADAFAKAKHYMADEIGKRVDGIKSRYELLSEPMHIRRENLDETYKFYEFLRDVEEELSWVGERVVGVGEDADLGANLTQVQSLQKKHNQLESEIISHEPVVSSLSTRASGMVRSGHFASEQITESIGNLTDRFRELKDSAAVRRLRLADSLVSQSFYDEANELLSWMAEKSNYTRNVEFKEHENVSGLLKRLELFQRDLGAFSERIDKVCRSGEELVGRGHFDEVNIKKKIEELRREYSELQKHLDKKRCKVMDAKKFYEFNRACGEACDWINELMNIAGSEDYGKDVDHVEVLIQKFESFMGNVQESRAAVVQNLADELVEEGYPEPDKIKSRAAEVKSLWDEFKELAAARLEALQGAKQVHSFDRTADETISWVNEKYSAVCSEEYGHDLESIQSLIRRHGVFENDLKPVEAKVNEVKTEADRLRTLFPDASEHLNVKLHACMNAWTELVERTRSRGDKLNQAENLQAYFDKYTELMAFVNELVAKVTSGELGRTVPAAEASVAKNKSYLKEIDKFKGVDEFVGRGNELVRKGHFMGDEINEKIKVLSGRWGYLKNVVRERNDLFEKNLDLRVYLVQLDEFDKWLSGKEPELKNIQLGESIREVEELIREHEEFVHTLEAQETRVEALRRKTLIEEAWEAMKAREREEREVENKRLERERVEMMKRKEVERITMEINKKREGDNVGGASSSRDGGDHVNQERSGGGSSGGRGGFLGNTRFGSFVFGKDGRRGSEPTTPTRELLPSNGLKQITLTPPPSLEHLSGACSQQQSSPAAETSSPLSRSESLRLLNTTTHDAADTGTLKKPKRTPSFTTRRRTASFRNKKKHPENLPPVEIEGYLERKHELQAGGKRAAVRSWKHYYVLLCGQLICFFKDQEDFEMSKVGSSSPITVYQAKCEVATDYTKRKYVFRVKPTDGSEFLFAAETREIMDGWVKKINFHAALEPKNQLERMEDGSGEPAPSSATLEESSSRNSSMMMPPPPPPPKKQQYDSTSTDDEDDQFVVARKPKPRGNLQQPRSREPIYANHEENLNAESVTLRNSNTPTTAAAAAKPPIPPRSSSIVLPEPNGRSPMKHNGSSSTDTIDNQQYFLTQQQKQMQQQQQRPLSVDRTLHAQQQRYYVQQKPESLVQPQPPPSYGLYPSPLPRSNINNMHHHTLQEKNTFKPQQQQQQIPQHHHLFGANRINNVVSYQQQQQQPFLHHSRGSSSLSRDFIPISVVSTSSVVPPSSLVYSRGPTLSPSSPGGAPLLSPRSSGSLPPGLTLQQQQQSPNSTFHDHNSSSENEQGLHSSSPSPLATHDSHDGGGNSSSSKKSKKGKPERDQKGSGEGSGLLGLFKRKKATQL